MADEEDREPAASEAQPEGSEGSQGSEDFDWSKPLGDPKLEAMRKRMLSLHGAKSQELAAARRELEEERARLRQEIEDEVLQALEEPGRLEAPAESEREDQRSTDESVTDVEALRKALRDVQEKYGQLERVFMEERTQRAQEELRMRILRAMSKYPGVFPSEDTEDEQEQAFLADAIEQVALQYMRSGDARARRPVGPSVKAVVDRINYLKTRGRKVVQTVTEETGRRSRPRAEGGGGHARIPDEFKDMGLDDPRFVERIIATTQEEE